MSLLPRVGRTHAYVSRPPYARWLDVVFRAAALAGIAAMAVLQLLWPLGLSGRPRTLFGVYELGLYGALLLVSLVCLVAVCRRDPFLEALSLPGVSGLLLAHTILSSGFSPVRPGLFVALSLALLFAARLNFLLALSSEARRLK